MSRWRRFVVRPLVWLLAALALAALGIWLLLDSELARSRVRDFAAGRLAEALGRRVAIASVEFELVPPTLVVHDLTIAGDRPDGEPFATLARGEVTADLSDLGASLVTLRRVELSGLDLRLEFRPDGGSNLPRLRAGGGKATQVVLGGLAIADSRLHLDHQVVPLELTASAVQARLVGAGDRGLDGSLAAQSVSLVLPRAQPLELAVASRLRLDGDRLEIHRARVTGRDLFVAADGEIGLTGGGAVRLDTRATARAELLDRLGWLDGELAGAVEFAGEVAWSPATWKVGGRLSSPQLDVVDFALAELSGAVSVDAAGAELAVERARWADGDLAGSFAVRFAPRYPARLDLELADAAVDAVLARFEVPATGVRGRLGGPLRYEFDLLAATSGRGEGEFTLAGEASGRVGVALADGRVTLDPIDWSAGGQRVAGRGEVALADGAGALQLGVASEDVGALAAMLPFLEPGALWLPTSGTGEMAVGVQFDRGGYAVDVELAAAAIVAPGIAAERARGAVRIDPRRARIARLELERGAARLRLAGEIPLAAGAPPMELALELVDWPFADAAPWLPIELPIAGDVRGSVALRGAVESPTGSADVVLAPAELAGFAASRLAARLEWDQERLLVHAARADFDAGGVEGAGTLRFADQALDVALASPSLALDRPPLAWAEAPSLAGQLELSARLGGTLAAPEITVAASARDATLAGRPLAAGGLTARADWRAGRLAGELDLGGEARLVGGGELVVGRAARLEFELTSPRIGRLVALATGGSVAGLEGELAADIAVDWPAGAPPRVEIRVPTLELAWQGQFLHSLEPLVAHLDGSRLRLESVYLGAAERDGDELFVGGTVDFGDDPRFDLHVQAALDAAWLESFVGDIDVSGRLDLLANLRGSAARPAWSGQAGWSDGRLLPPLLPHTLERGRALLLIYPNALVLDRLHGDFAGGDFDLSGRVQLRDGALGSYRFEATGRRLNLRWPSGWQLRGDADLTLQSTASGRLFGGAVELDRAYYFQDIDLSPAELVQRLLARSPVLVPETDELLASSALDVAVRAPGGLRIRNNVASMDGSADLAVRGSLAR
ncbi:MAG: hypothetical protein NDJ75_07580, partial [Thermoanaerobaculia bacterium]|nr:hypothetical protein [Thermoanaerobaculia bacterium]